MKKRPELLLPAGSMEKLRFAIAFGADAVYAGVPMFSLRAKENKFDLGFLEEAVKYCRKHKKAIYFTINIMPRNFKVNAFLNAFKKMLKLNPDAFIVSDPGIVMIIHDNFPKAVVHLSVQANTMNWASAKFWENQGVERIILSRELSLAEIKEIKDKNPSLELETFVHGSICIAHSGRCLISNYLSQRDANQGLCAHSCRWKWKVNIEEEERPGEFHEILEDEYGTHIMNSRDMCAIEVLKDLWEIGMDSLKVEGRNKTIYYASIVARAYRKALDEIENGKIPNLDFYLKELAKTSNRGFIPGFFKGDLGNASIEYDERAEHSTHCFAGVVRDFKNGEIEMEVKNRIETSDNLEFCFPSFDDDFSLQDFKMRYGDGEQTSVAHGGDKNVFISIPNKFWKRFDKEIFCVARKAIPVQSST